MANIVTIVVKIDVVGHASPRYRSAKSDATADKENLALSKQRAENVLKQLKTDLAPELEALGHKLRFVENVSYQEDVQPENSVAIGGHGRGSVDSRQQTGNDRSNNDPQYRRADINVRIAIATQYNVPYVYVKTYDQDTTTNQWYISIGFQASAGIKVDVNFSRCTIRNMWGQQAEGMIISAGYGYGGTYKSGDRSLKGVGTPLDFSPEAPFTTRKPTDFRAFHGALISLSTAGFVSGFGYSATDVQFLNPFGDIGSQIISLKGWTTGFQAQIQVTGGLLILDTVPPNYEKKVYTTTQWDTLRSDWIVQRFNTIKFATGVSSLDAIQISDITLFAQEIAREVDGSA